MTRKRYDKSKYDSLEFEAESLIPARTLSHREARHAFGHDIMLNLTERPVFRRSKGPANEIKVVRNAISSGNFHDAFVPLKIMRDYYRGITTTLEYHDDSDRELTRTHYQEHETGRPVLVRDARSQSNTITNIHYQCEASYFKYAQLGLNYLSGMIVLLEKENERRKNAGEKPYIDIDTVKEDLIQYAEVYYCDIVPDDPNDQEQQKAAEYQADRKFGRFFHSVIKPFYQQYRPNLNEKQLEHELQLGRHFANLKVDPYAVATLSRHEVDRTFKNKASMKSKTGRYYIDAVELELPMVELTQEMADDINDIINDRCNKEWYVGQSDMAKVLIKEYAPKLKKGAMIPAQLIYHLIGTRNGYEKWTAVLVPANKAKRKPGTYKLVNRSHHAGSQAHLLELPNLESDTTESHDEKLSEYVVKLLSRR